MLYYLTDAAPRFFQKLTPSIQYKSMFTTSTLQNNKEKMFRSVYKVFLFHLCSPKQNRITVNLIISLFFTLYILSRSSKQPMWNRPVYRISHKDQLSCALWWPHQRLARTSIGMRNVNGRRAHPNGLFSQFKAFQQNTSWRPLFWIVSWTKEIRTKSTSF